MHRALIKKIVEKGSPEDMEHLEDLMIDMIDHLKVIDEDEYEHIEHKLYKMVYGKHLSKDLAHRWVESMSNKDGTHGEHWTMEQTSQFAGKHNPIDFYAVLNMMYSDYYNPKFETATYVELANDWLDDSDVGECKTLDYYWHVVK